MACSCSTSSEEPRHRVTKGAGSPAPFFFGGHLFLTERSKSQGICDWPRYPHPRLPSMRFDIFDPALVGAGRSTRGSLIFPRTPRSTGASGVLFELTVRIFLTRS